MNATERAAQLRAEADALDALAGLELAAAEAKANYQADPTEENKASHREASVALNEARAASRASRVGPVGGDAFVSTGGEG